MQYENVFKVIGVVHVILDFLKLLLLLKVSRRGWLLVLLRLLNVYSRSQRQNKVQHIHIHANKAKLRNNTTLHKNSKQNRARTILRVTTIA